MDPRLCVKCKGKDLLCGRPKCPILIKREVYKGLKPAKDVDGFSVNILVGERGYPKVKAGPIISLQSREMDVSEKMYGIPLERLVTQRASTYRGSFVLDVKRPDDKLWELALSKKSEIYAEFRKEPKARLTFSPYAIPYGPSAPLKVWELDPLRTNFKLEKVAEDDLKAADAIYLLWKKGVSVDDITRALSVGLLSIEKRVVPTRWAITATDDTIFKSFFNDIKSYDEVNGYLVFSNEYLGNHFEILIAPGKWFFEQIEIYTPGCVWVSHGRAVVIRDWEGYRGRKSYAENVEGAYYAARLAVGEYLVKVKRQGMVLVVREIKKEYYVPVGVWQIRENCRAALRKKPRRFDNLRDALEDMKSRLETKGLFIKHSELLQRIRAREQFLKLFQTS